MTYCERQYDCYERITDCYERITDNLERQISPIIFFTIKANKYISFCDL